MEDLVGQPYATANGFAFGVTDLSEPAFVFKVKLLVIVDTLFAPFYHVQYPILPSPIAMEGRCGSGTLCLGESPRDIKFMEN